MGGFIYPHKKSSGFQKSWLNWKTILFVLKQSISSVYRGARPEKNVILNMLKLGGGRGNVSDMVQWKNIFQFRLKDTILPGSPAGAITT